MKRLENLSYEEFNRMCDDKDLTLTQLKSWPFDETEGWLQTSIRAILGQEPKDPNPWWDEFKLVELEGNSGRKGHLLIKFDKYDHDKCNIFTGIPDEVGIFMILSERS